MAREDGASIWKVLSSTAAMVSAATVFSVAAIGGIGWVAGYFAKEGELNHFKCRTALRLDIAEHLIVANNFYARYVNAKVNVVFRTLGNADLEPALPAWPGLEENRSADYESGKAEIYFQRSQDAKNDAELLRKRLAKGLCPEDQEED